METITIYLTHVVLIKSKDNFTFVQKCNEIYSEVHTGKQLSAKFPIQNSLKQDDAFYCHCSYILL
jgi:hypothetical protein